MEDEAFHKYVQYLLLSGLFPDFQVTQNDVLISVLNDNYYCKIISNYKKTINFPSLVSENILAQWVVVIIPQTYKLTDSDLKTALQKGIGILQIPAYYNKNKFTPNEKNWLLKRMWVDKVRSKMIWAIAPQLWLSSIDMRESGKIMLTQFNQLLKCSSILYNITDEHRQLVNMKNKMSSSTLGELHKMLNDSSSLYFISPNELSKFQNELMDKISQMQVQKAKEILFNNRQKLLSTAEKVLKNAQKSNKEYIDSWRQQEQKRRQIVKMYLQQEKQEKRVNYE